MTTALIEWGCVAALAAVAQWIAVYTVLEPWWQRRNQIGHSLVLFALFAMVTPAVFLAALLFHASRQALSWTEIVLLWAYLPAMAWRSVVWVRASRAARHAGR